MSSIIIYANGLTIDMDEVVIPDGVYSLLSPLSPLLPSLPSAGGSPSVRLVLLKVPSY